jgi:hypothetical protein
VRISLSLAGHSDNLDTGRLSSSWGDEDGLRGGDGRGLSKAIQSATDLLCQRKRTGREGGGKEGRRDVTLSLAKAPPAKRAMVAARMVVNCIFAVAEEEVC